MKTFVILRVKDWIKKRSKIRALMNYAKSIRQLNGNNNFSDFPELERQALAFTEAQLEWAEQDIKAAFAKAYERHSAQITQGG
jgi:hypothetical protein